MANLEYKKKDYTHMENQPCVYKIWFNSYYYIGATSNLENRINNHIAIIKRLAGSGSSSPKIRKVYRKLIKLINREMFISIDVEILLSDKPLEATKEYEKQLLYSNYNCSYSINNVKKKFETV